MNVRKLRSARRTDRSNPLTFLDPDARSREYTAIFQMAILRAQSIFVLDHHSVSAFPAGNTGLVPGIVIDLIWHAVAVSQNLPVCHSHHGNVLSDIIQRAQADVPTIMSLIACSSAKRVQHCWRRINVGHLLNEAVRAEHAIDG